MKQSLLTLFSAFSLLHAHNASAQAAIETQAIFGGRINAMAGCTNGVSSSRVFIATESANSIYYADVSTPPATAATFGTFQILPCADASSGLGSGIQRLAAHTASLGLAFINNQNLYFTKPPYTTANNANLSLCEDVKSKGNNMFILRRNDTITWATLDATGAVTSMASAKFAGLNVSFGSKLHISGYDGYLYVFKEGSTPTLTKSSDAYGSFSASTTFSSISLSSLSASVVWSAFGVTTSGRLIVGGAGSTGKVVAYSDDNGATWTSVNTGINGASAPNFDFYTNGLGAHHVFYAKCYSADNGATWSEFGNAGMQTHPNDGSVLVVPGSMGLLNSAVCMTTDQGIGASTNGGSVIFEINNGVRAVQTDDFDMNAAKTDGWLASKAGIWRVSNFQTTPTWSSPMFPNGDGSPYYSADMIGNNGNEAYVGNVRIYKTTNNGATWTRVFTPENAPYNFVGGIQARSIKVDPTNSNLVLAGFSVQGNDKGGLFYSSDAGNTWQQLLLVAGSVGQDADVRDIAFNTEGGASVAYVGVEYNGGSPASYSVYRCVWNGSSWTVGQDMSGANTDLGTAYVVTIEDIEISTTGDTLVAGGVSASGNPVLYYRMRNGTNKWTWASAYTAGGSPWGVQSVAIGFDTVFYNLNNNIYYKKLGASTGMYYNYPVGTQINFLYYDALLAGTGTGMDNVSNPLPLVLPVELTEFKAAVNRDNAVDLTWTTAASSNADGYDLERAELTFNSTKSRLSFSTLTFVKDRAEAANYTYCDNTAVKGKTYYYRLKMMDMDGSFQYSRTISISISDRRVTMTTFPNPVLDRDFNINVNLPSGSDNAAIDIIDLTGRSIKRIDLNDRGEGAHNVSVSTHDLPNGTYLCRLQTASETLVQQIVILK